MISANIKRFKTLQKLVVDEIQCLFESVLVLPLKGVMGTYIRKKYWGAKLRKLGRNSVIGRHTILGFPELIEIGENSSIGEYCAISAACSDGIFIGSDVMIARGTYIHSANHKIDNLRIPISQQGTETMSLPFKGEQYSVIIEDDVWIGSNVVILAGTHLGTGSVVSAGAVVSGTIAPFSMLVGNPARIVFNRKKRFGDESH